MADTVGGTHHVKIGDEFYLIRPGTYRKQGAPLMGARFTTGDPDYNTLNVWQYWPQTCWVGGFGAETWQDDAMYDEGVGVDGSQHEVMVLARDLGPDGSARSTQNWDLNGEVLPRVFTVFNDKLYLLQAGSSSTSRLYVLDPSTPQWTLIKTFTEQVSAMESFGGYLVFGDQGTTLNRMNTSEVFSTFAKPSGVTDKAYALKTYRGRLYVGFGRQIWRLKTDFTWDGSTAFYTAEDINYINHMEVHLGQIHFASRNGHILRSDGNNTYDLWAFEPHVVIWGMRSFDGRLFIGAGEALAGTTSTQAVLYQFSGAAVTELKRWGNVNKDVLPGKLRAVGESLYFGASSLLGMQDGFGIARYDAREDAYHIFASNSATATYSQGTEGSHVIVDDVIYFKGYFYCSVRYHGVFRTLVSYKDVSRFQATYDTSASGASVGSQNGGWFTSSDYDAGTPGLLKLWDAITIHADIPTTDTSIYVEYSLDGGQVWHAAGSVLKTGSATRYAKTFDLRISGEKVTGTRMKYRLTLRTTNSAYSPQLRGVVVRYLPIPEPNWQWSFSVLLSENQELLDKTLQEPTIATKLANLEAAFRTQIPVYFQDIDGTEWGAGPVGQVLIRDFVDDVRYVGPSGDGEIEHEVRLILLETKDEYEVTS